MVPRPAAPASPASPKATGAAAPGSPRLALTPRPYGGESTSPERREAGAGRGPQTARAKKNARYRNGTACAAAPWQARLEGLSLGKTGLALRGYFEELSIRPDGLQDAIHHPGEGAGTDEVLPFPMPSKDGREYLQKIDVRKHNLEEVAAWLWLVMHVLNQGRPRAKLAGGLPTDRQQKAAGLLVKQILDFVELRSEGLKGQDWKAFLKTRSLSYCGSEVSTAMRVTWAQIEPGLPPADRCGSIQALDLCEPTVRSFLCEPMKAL
eukprot:7830345-Karenia_brevis.AAC.1